jgi:hypothetical protein
MEPSIGAEHYGKAAVAALEANSLMVSRPLGDIPPEQTDLVKAQIKATLALAHALLSDTANRGYDTDKLARAMDNLAGAIRVHGS